ncbi:Mdm33 family-domain-containing protein [Xylariomycetidae sp. FL0641]|nr:Mdm33 family-domain-containing protein [Xylariomycetidae sp. FL0641]
MDRAQSSLFLASKRINDLTGYSGIEALKQHIMELEQSLSTAQAELLAAREAYKTAVADRSATQREVTTLLARQKTWTPADFERFTSLYREDYELEASVGAAARALEEAERRAEKLAQDLNQGILARYHEEQIWSDKIRRMSTWGTWGLMGVNVLLFLALQFGAEPWRRRRLVRGFEDKVREALADERAHYRPVPGSEATTADHATAEVPAAAAEAAEVTIDAPVSAEQANTDVPVTLAPEAAAPPPIPIPMPTGDTLIIESIPPAPQPVEPAAVPAEKEMAEEMAEEKIPATPWWRDTPRWKAALLDLASERVVRMRMRDVSLVALEGAAAGACFAAAVAVAILRRA